MKTKRITTVAIAVIVFTYAFYVLITKAIYEPHLFNF